jgi:hypothetical protein
MTSEPMCPSTQVSVLVVGIFASTESTVPTAMMVDVRGVQRTSVVTSTRISVAARQLASGSVARRRRTRGVRRIPTDVSNGHAPERDAAAPAKAQMAPR